MNKLRVLDLFSGIGGFSLGLERTGGFETVAFCEIEPFPRRVLAKHWPEVPQYHDVRTLTKDILARDGIGVDVICGGFPCQDASVARTAWGKRTGAEGERTGLFREIVRLADEIRPAVVVLENVTGLLDTGFGSVLGALAEIGFDAEWRVISAYAAGLPHRRERLWIVAYPSGSGLSRSVGGESLLERAERALPEYRDEAAGAWRALDERLDGLRGCDGVSVGMDRPRVKACGNAVVPQIPRVIGRAILEARAA